MKLDSIDNTEVAIRVDGELLTEYHDYDDIRSCGTIAVSHIEVTSGANFSIHVRTDNSRLRTHEQAIRYTVSLDGETVNARNIRHFDRDGSARGQSEGRGAIRDGQEVLMRYQFGDLVTDDEPPSEDLDRIQVKYLGEIQVTMCVVRLVTRTGGTAKREALLAARTNETLVPETISEKCLKGRAISHVAKFGQPEIARKSRGRASERRRHEEPTSVTYPYGKTPFATFVFKYRSRKDLQIEGIIPRDPSPSPAPQAPHDNLPIEMTREVVRYPDIAEQMHEHNFNWPKREPDAVTIESKISEEVVALAQVPSKRRDHCRQMWHDMDIIDLTGDD